MRFLGRTERRVVLAILVTALVPLVGAALTGRAMLGRVSAAAFQPEFGALMDQSLGVYADLVRAIKQGMRYEADALAATPSLVRAATGREREQLRQELVSAFATHADLLRLTVEDAEGTTVATHQRERPLDEATERSWTQRRPLGDDDGAPILVVTFATPSARFTELESAQDLVQAYHQLERGQREVYLDATYQRAFAAILIVTILAGIGVGLLVARPVTRRIARLGLAMRPVAEGDLDVRVPVEGTDEVSDLARAMNRMLAELAENRGRIEYLRLMAEWQKVARRLAHEIKNPLQPIQLAVEEAHRRYAGAEPAYQRLLDTTLEVVSEEVSSLRRLVSEFSSFARLPKAEPEPADLAEFVREQASHMGLGGTDGEGAELFRDVALEWDIADGPMPATVDREMMHRALVNVVQNAAQALRDAKRGGKILVSLRADKAGYVLAIDDEGPGIEPSVRATLFDPYVTTKRDGTGLGLSIVKKIVLDHGGTIDAKASPLGGARFEIRLPRANGP